MRSGEQGTLYGEDFGFAPSGTSEASAHAIENPTDNAKIEFHKKWGVGTEAILKKLDDALPPANIAKPIVGLTDPTHPIVERLEDFIEYLRELVGDAYEWIFEHAVELPDIFTPEIMEEVADCEVPDNPKLVSGMQEVDPSIDENKLKESSKNISDGGKLPCNFSLELPEFPFPPSFNFPLPIIDPWDWEIFFGTLELPSWTWDWDGWLGLNLIFWKIGLALSDLLLKWSELIDIIVAAIKDGIDAIIRAVVKFVQTYFILPLQDALEILMATVGFVAIMNAILAMITGSLIVLLVAFVLGAGFISLGVAYKLELVS